MNNGCNQLSWPTRYVNLPCRQIAVYGKSHRGIYERRSCSESFADMQIHLCGEMVTRGKSKYANQLSATGVSRVIH